MDMACSLVKYFYLNSQLAFNGCHTMLIISKSSDIIIEGHPALTGTLIGFATLCSTYEESKEGLGFTIKIMAFPASKC